jgi:hypothetical protein
VKDMVRGENKSVTITDEHKIRRNIKTADIITCVEENDYRKVFDKRVLMDDFTTFPSYPTNFATSKVPFFIRF